MIPIDEALKHRSEFDQRWFLLPIGIVLASFFAFGLIVMIPHAAPDTADNTLAGDEPIAVTAGATP